jgi:3-hydroxyacyl-[acyl-carrier-protein] dehydratase
MRFSLIDRIVELTPGERITAVKSLSLAEEYLDDHFPLFPVMPGVLMLEAMTEAGAWLVRASEDFAHSIVVLREARNVKFADFVEPGQVLTVTAEITGQDGCQTQIKAKGMVGDVPAVAGRLVLGRYNWADESPTQAELDHYIRRKLRERFGLLRPPTE